MSAVPSHFELATAETVTGSGRDQAIHARLIPKDRDRVSAPPKQHESLKQLDTVAKRLLDTWVSERQTGAVLPIQKRGEPTSPRFQ